MVNEAGAVTDSAGYGHVDIDQLVELLSGESQDGAVLSFSDGGSDGFVGNSGIGIQHTSTGYDKSSTSTDSSLPNSSPSLVKRSWYRVTVVEFVFIRQGF